MLIVRRGDFSEARSIHAELLARDVLANYRKADSQHKKCVSIHF
jgi:hypothetical protein